MKSMDMAEALTLALEVAGTPHWFVLAVGRGATLGRSDLEHVVVACVHVPFPLKPFYLADRAHWERAQGVGDSVDRVLAGAREA